MTPFFLLSIGALTPGALALQPRQPLPRMELHALDLPDTPIAGWRLTFKLRDELKVRATESGGLRSEVGADLSELLKIAQEEGLRFRPLIDLDPQLILGVEARAAARSGRAQADLQGMLRVEGLADGKELVRIGQRLQGLASVEYAFVETVGSPPPGFFAAPPGDIGTATDDFSPLQTWLGPDPGLNVLDAWDRGLTGEGVQVSDVEYGWNNDHEDLNDRDLNLEAGTAVPGWVLSYGWDEHGTAVLGQIAAGNNGYGVTGGAYDVQIATFPEYTDAEGSRRAAAITSAVAASAEGDVILLEMQAVTRPGGNYGPAELDPNVFTAVQTGVDAGVTIVGAAGNGSENLDSGFYKANYLAWGDSGAIIVGAGSPDAAHDIAYFSTYGSRVDVQAWGFSIVTTAYGDLAAVDRDKNQYYTREFGGTSGASPMVTLVAALLQGYAREHMGGPIDPLELRALLIETGIPQGAGGHIGPMPDVIAALEELDPDGTGDGGATDGGGTDGGGTDGGGTDGGGSDGGGTDGGGTDGGGDTGDGGGDTGGDGGGEEDVVKDDCGGCAVGGPGARGLGAAWLVLVPGVVLLRRRRAPSS